MNYLALVYLFLALSFLRMEAQRGEPPFGFSIGKHSLAPIGDAGSFLSLLMQREPFRHFAQRGEPPQRKCLTTATASPQRFLKQSHNERKDLSASNPRTALLRFFALLAFKNCNNHEKQQLFNLMIAPYSL